MVVFATHIVSYVFVSDYLLTNSVYNNYISFSKRRLSNPYNRNVNETVYLSSCGDEFFRNHDRNTYVVKISNPNFESQDFPGNQYYQNVITYPYDSDVVEIFRNEIDSTGSVTCVIYSVCKRTHVPLLYAEIETFEGFSSYMDLHAMIHNEQLENSRYYYVWCLFFWLEIKSDTLNE